MNRREEYLALCAALEHTPPALEDTVSRAVARRAGERKKRRRIFGMSLGSLASCAAAFVLLVNLSVPFAKACGSVPVLRELAKAVAWSPSLAAAVEQEYVQPIGQSQTKNGVTAAMEYVIVDQKRVNLFFTLKGEGYEALSADLTDLAPDRPCSIQGADFRQPPGTLLCAVLDYADADVPGEMDVTFSVTGWNPEEDDGDALPEEPAEKALAVFTFHLTFNPYYTAQGKTVAVNRTFSMDGQRLTVTKAEIYPTHLRLHVVGDEENTAWLQRLSCSLESKSGKTYDTVAGGIVSTGSAENPNEKIFYLESPYFSDSDGLTLQVTGAEWLDKDQERVRVDLRRRTADFLPEGVTFQSAVREGEGWRLSFRVRPRREGFCHQVFGTEFYGADGTVYDSGGYSMLTLDQGGFLVELPLPDYPEDTVWLAPVYSHTTQEDPPIRIPLT